MPIRYCTFATESTCKWRRNFYQGQVMPNHTVECEAELLVNVLLDWLLLDNKPAYPASGFVSRRTSL